MTAPKSGTLHLAIAAGVAILVVAAAVVAMILEAPPTESQHIAVARVWTDRVDAPSGTQYSLVEVNATNTGTSPWHVDPALFVLSSNASAKYPFISTYNETALLGETDVAPGQQILGKLAFELPVSEVPSRLSYSDSAGRIALEVARLPPVSAIASRFDLNVRLTVNGEPVAAGGWTATATHGTYLWVGSLIASGVVLKSSLVFFSGQVVQVNLWFEYLNKPADPTTVRLVSAFNDDGFAVLSETTLPQTMNGWASQAGVDFLLKVPPGEHSGSLSFSVQFSP